MYGQSHGLFRRCIVGARFDIDTLAGSRSIACDSFSTNPDARMSVRGCKENCIILGVFGTKNINI